MKAVAMKKITLVFSFLAVFALLTCLLLFPVVALHAAEGHGGSKSEASKAEGEDKKEDKKEDKEKKDDKKSSGSEVVTGGRFSGDPVYVHVRPIYLPIITDNGAEQIVTLMVDLKVKDIAMANRFQDNMPRVRDALMQVLYGGLGNGSLRNGTLVDVIKVKNKISKSLTKVMGDESVEEVLIQAIAQRRM